jgi:hypothetical protein
MWQFLPWPVGSVDTFVLRLLVLFQYEALQLKEHIFPCNVYYLRKNKWNSNFCFSSCYWWIAFECRCWSQITNVCSMLIIHDSSHGLQQCYKSEEHKTYLKDGGSMFLWNIHKFLADATCWIARNGDLHNRNWCIVGLTWTPMVTILLP